MENLLANKKVILLAEALKICKRKRFQIYHNYPNFEHVVVDDIAHHFEGLENAIVFKSHDYKEIIKFLNDNNDKHEHYFNTTGKVDYERKFKPA